MFSKYRTVPCVLVSLCLCVFASGCIPLLIGAGIVTGVMTTKDTVSGNFDVSRDKLWTTALEVVQEKADITDQNEAAGLIKAKVNHDEIVVKIKELTESSQNLRVTARKALALANLTLAQEVFSKIVRNLEHANLK